MKKILWLLIFTSFSVALEAQFIQIEDAMSKGKQKGLRIHLDTFNKNIANDAIIKVMGEYDHKVDATILSFNELFYNDIKIQNIATNPVDFYAKVKEVDSSIMLFVDFGASFLDLSTHVKEGEALQKIATEIRQTIRDVFKKQNIDTLKKKIKIVENKLEIATDSLKYANNTIKNNIKGAANNDKTVVETSTRLADEKAQMRAIDSIRLIKEKEFNAFPLVSLKTVNKSKNVALDKNINTRKNLIKDNLKSSQLITEYETEITLNKGSIEIVKDDPKASKKLIKANQKLTTKINDEKLKITINDASIKTINSIITADSLIVKTNVDSLDKFDENGRKKELKQMENKKQKLLTASIQDQLEIDKNKFESEQRKKESETLAKRLESMQAKQLLLSSELEMLKKELNLLTKK